MQEIVGADTAFHRRELPIDDAIRLFKDRGMDDKVKLIETSGQVYMDYYLLGDTVDYYYGRLVPSAGYLRVWALQPLQGGILLRVPDRHHPEQLAPYIEQLKTAKSRPTVACWSEFDSELAAAVTEVVNGDKTAQEAMDELAVKVDALLAE